MIDQRERTGFSRVALGEILARDGGGPIPALRRRSFQRFQTMPMPSPDTEEWRYTDVRELDLSSFLPLAEEEAAASLDHVGPEVREAAGDVGERAGLSIQHNSTVVATHLDPELQGRGVTLSSIDQAVQAHPRLIRKALHRAVPPERTRFTALHGAFRTGGAFVHVPAGVSIEQPLEALTYVDREGLAVFPHTVLVVEENAQLTFVDRYASVDLGSVLSDAVVEIYAGPGSRIRYISLQEWGRGVTHLSVQRAEVGRDADVRSLAVAFGADLARAEAESVLAEPGGSSEMLGVYVADGDQHFDHRSIQDHIGSFTKSDLLYKGALKQRSRTIYSGTVTIRPNAHKCDAYQTNRNILLSDEAKADSIPNLEIQCNDPVRCGHAASVGPVDEDTLFYIQSRGIPYREAERLIVFGFFQEVLDRVSIPEVRHALERAIVARIERKERN